MRSTMKLPESNTERVDKRDARIYWSNYHWRLEDLVVYSARNEEEVRQVEELIKESRLLFLGEAGNMLADWMEWDLADVLLEVNRKYIEKDKVLSKVMRELARINEFRAKIQKHYRYLFKELCE